MINTRGYVRYFVTSVVLVLLFSGQAFAASTVDVFVELTNWRISIDGNAAMNGYGFDLNVDAEDDFASDSDSNLFGGMLTSEGPIYAASMAEAGSEVLSASAQGFTALLENENAWAGGASSWFLSYEIGAGGAQISVSADYSFYLGLSTQGVGDYAYGYTMVQLGIWPGLADSVSGMDELEQSVVNGGSFKGALGGTLEASLFLDEGDWAEVWFDLEAEADLFSAGVTHSPLPSSLILMGFGLLGITRFCRRDPS